MTESYQIDSKQLSVLDSIKAIQIKEFRSIILNHKGSSFVKFLLLAVGIEYLGACLDEKPFNEPHESEDRFNRALKKLFDKKYHKFTKKAAKVYLYRDFRCNFVHQIRPAKNIVITHTDESRRENTKHLENIIDSPLVLVLEEFYNDYEKACNRLIRGFESGKYSNKKGNQGYLKYTNVRNNRMP